LHVRIGILFDDFMAVVLENLRSNATLKIALSERDAAYRMRGGS